VTQAEVADAMDLVGWVRYANAHQRQGVTTMPDTQNGNLRALPGTGLRPGSNSGQRLEAWDGSDDRIDPQSRYRKERQ
jgi:hypothetical protein